MIVSLLAGAMLLNPPRVDDAAMAIVKAARDKVAAASSVSGTATQGEGKDMTVYKFRLSKPNLLEIRSPHFEYHSDGKDLYMYMVDSKQYQKTPTPKGAVLMLYGFEPLLGGQVPNVKNAAAATFAGKAAVKALLQAENSPVQMAVYFDKATKLPMGWSQTYSGRTLTFTYSDLKVGDPMGANTFAWTPPAGASEYKQPDFMASLLKDGAEAPDFTNATPTGGKINLKETIGKSKAVLLNFWFYG